MKKANLKLVTLSQEYIDILSDPEVLYTEESKKRANLLVVKLSFHDSKYSFAIPWRSNVPNDGRLDDYIFNLPPTSKTKERHVACLDFRKMCPITKKGKCLYQKYNVSGFTNDINTIMFIEKNLPSIIKRAQRYLSEYENHKIPEEVYGRVDLNGALKKLEDKGY